MKRANSTSFKPGQSGNPRGRPRGIQETRPRNSVRAAWNAVTDRYPKLVEDVIYEGLSRGRKQGRMPGRPLDALPFVTLGARVNREIGADPGQVSRPVTIIVNTNVDPMKLRVKVSEPPEGEEEDGET